MVESKSEKRRWLRALTARPKLSVSFGLVIFLLLLAGAKLTTPLPQATAVVEIRADPLRGQIAALESGLAPEPIAISREAERLRSVDMALSVLARLPEDEVTAIGSENGLLKPTWLADRLASLCSPDSALAAIARLLCPVVPAGDIQGSAQVAALRDALEITAVAEHGQILISFSAADPDRAAAIANLYAETYVQQRQSEKQRLRQRIVDWITERRQIIDSAIGRAVHADAAGMTGEAQPDPTTEIPRSGPSGAASPSLQPDPEKAIAEQARAAQDEFLRQATPLLTSTAWAEPAAVVRSTASPPVRTVSLVGGLAPMLILPVSLVLGLALGRLVDIFWPAGERLSSFYDNPYWPQSGDDATPSRGRMLINAGPGRQLISTAAKGALDTRQEQMLPSSRYRRSNHATKQSR